MALKVVGSGLGRTGTKSMQTALNMLGFGPCHHMVEVFQHPESMALWVRASKGEDVWDQIFDGYKSMVDYPGAHYWRELAAKYPDAKVLHTTRDADKWFESTQATIFSPANTAVHESAGVRAEFFESFMGPMRANLADRAFMTEHFRRHEAEVKATIPAERLLVYEVGSGWGPLCAFLGVPVPDVPYPSENSREEFVARVRAAGGDTARVAAEIKAGGAKP
ncbi:MAG TPA: sulfotransferase [Caulobacteraceae bacterium]|nr:sulfotransferase [Caulobacteraceae bacterium]